MFIKEKQLMHLILLPSDPLKQESVLDIAEKHSLESVNFVQSKISHLLFIHAHESFKSIL